MNPNALTPAEVADAPWAVVDPGDGRWPPLVDPKLLIADMWRKQREMSAQIIELRKYLLALAAEMNATQTTLGVNPHGAHATVATRLAAVEQQLDTPTP